MSQSECKNPNRLTYRHRKQELQTTLRAIVSHGPHGLVAVGDGGYVGINPGSSQGGWTALNSGGPDLLSVVCVEQEVWVFGEQGQALRGGARGFRHLVLPESNAYGVPLGEVSLAAAWTSHRGVPVCVVGSSGSIFLFLGGLWKTQALDDLTPTAACNIDLLGISGRIRILGDGTYGHSMVVAGTLGNLFTTSETDQTWRWASCRCTIANLYCAAVLAEGLVAAGEASTLLVASMGNEFVHRPTRSTGELFFVGQAGGSVLALGSAGLVLEADEDLRGWNPIPALDISGAGAREDLIFAHQNFVVGAGGSVYSIDLGDCI